MSLEPEEMGQTGGVLASRPAFFMWPCLRQLQVGKAPWRLVVLVSYPYWAMKRPDTGTNGLHLGNPDFYQGFGNSINVPLAAV